MTDHASDCALHNAPAREPGHCDCGAYLPPGPFHYETTAAVGDHHGKGHVYIVDSNGRKIAALWGPPDTKLATAALIIEARATKENG